MLALSSSHVWSRRALKEVFVDLVVSGLASMYPVSSWSWFAPDHHGYQRACVLISGQASTGPSGSPVFACAGKTDPPSLLILSQTSAGNGTAGGPAAAKEDRLADGVVILIDSNEPYVMGHAISYSANLAKHFADKGARL